MRLAVKANKVSKSNLMGLLLALGQETAGALSLSLAEPPSPSHREATKRLLNRDELSARIRSRPQEAFTVWDGKVRLSIAGHQDKIAVLEENRHWYLVDGEGLASTHIGLVALGHLSGVDRQYRCPWQKPVVFHGCGWPEPGACV